MNDNEERRLFWAAQDPNEVKEALDVIATRHAGALRKLVSDRKKRAANKAAGLPAADPPSDHVAAQEAKNEHNKELRKIKRPRKGDKTMAEKYDEGTAKMHKYEDEQASKKAKQQQTKKSSKKRKRADLEEEQESIEDDDDILQPRPRTPAPAESDSE